MNGLDDSAALEVDDKDGTSALHGQYRQDKRALRGAKASAGGGRDETWQSEAALAEQDDETRAITLSSLPRGYWATLFNLEVVKARNRPIEPPKKPEAAPFFLATVHRDGEVAPSFADMPPATAGVGDKGKARVAVSDDDAAAGQSASSTALVGGDEGVPEFPSGGGGAWSDDDDDDGDAGGGERGNKGQPGGSEGGGEAGTGGVKRKVAEVAVAAPDAPPSARRSRILKQIKTSTRMGASGPSRCKLADLLLGCEETYSRTIGDVMDEEEEEKEEGGGGGGGRDGRGKRRRFDVVMVYLKKLPPPMVDVDISLLCQGDWDEEGVHLVGLAMQFLLEGLRWVGGWMLNERSLGRLVFMFCVRGAVERFGNRNDVRLLVP